MEKGNLELRKLTTLFKKKENVKNLEKSGIIRSLLDGTSPLINQVRPVYNNINQLVVQEREGNLNAANRNIVREPASR
jgi:hypothetical protein